MGLRGVGGQGEGQWGRRENKQSKCFAFHQSPAVLSFMSPRLQMPQPQAPAARPLIFILHSFMYLFISYISF